MDEIIPYNEIVDMLEHQFSEESEEERLWKFKCITAHEGTLKPTDDNCKGSSYNIMVEWEDGSCSAEPLHIIGADDPVSCAVYAKENNLLNTDGWKHFKQLANRKHKLECIVKKARLISVSHVIVYQFGVQVPRDIHEAHKLDANTNTTFWHDAIHLEISQLMDYDTFIGQRRQILNAFRLPKDPI